MLYEERLTVSERARLIGEIERLTGRDTDLIDLLEAGPVLKIQILENGQPLIVNDPGALASFQARVPSEYSDFKIERRAAENQLIASLTS